ncbi:efflux RND transporter periplasmic adaptor subunit [Paraglaciecola chathamensis]|uniref:Efflux RND transporter periplasmic adaptor subunit n=1 Tax=Paraglaciecola chathamensis TaxID=368405 RepID=A0ABS0W9K5_9ALTE|nr:efflux RND transporter periplasmic adaptor subunit [Paraglaciecola chathamensis]MBJ2135128.1 efflux RND transporter periplasmic adaptor subunit [Paraglaciecola chathamensis]
MPKGISFSPILIALILASGLLIYLYLPVDTEQQQKKSIATPVTAYTVSEVKFPVVVEALGTANANESVMLTAQKSDIVQSIEFDDGDLVEKGQLLIKLSDREERARLNELDINLQEAKRQLKRIDNLAQKSVASKQLLDEQEANVKALKAQLEVAKAQLEELELRAPFSGLLGVRQVSLGALVMPGDLIATLDDLHIIKMDFTIAESHLPSVRKGQQVSATSAAYPGETFKGEISSIASRVDPVTRAIQIRAIIDNKDLKLRPGMLLQISLEKDILNTLTLPEGALVPIEDKQFVFVIKGDKVERQEVKVGLRKPGIAQITSGLKEGDQVVIEGALRLREGSVVNVLSTHTSQG